MFLAKTPVFWCHFYFCFFFIFWHSSCIDYVKIGTRLKTIKFDFRAVGGNSKFNPRVLVR